VQEIQKHGLVYTPLEDTFSFTKLPTLATYQVFEDNASCIALAYSNGTKQHTKQISLKWYYFWDQLQNGSIKTFKVNASLNWANIFMKPLCLYALLNTIPFGTS
jgi:hypothetical protein